MVVAWQGRVMKLTIGTNSKPKETQSQVWFHCVETRFQETRIFIQHERENIGWIAGRDRHRRLQTPPRLESQHSQHQRWQ